MDIAHNKIGLLAPVPIEHLDSGFDVCAEEGKVAFGSRAWDVFEKLDGLRNSLPVEVFIYASWSDKEIRAATWHGLYVGHVRSDLGAHPAGMKFRPRTTEQYETDNAGYWAVFWEVTDLRRLPEDRYIPTGRFTGHGRRKPYRDNIAPEGPLIVELPGC